MFKKTSSKITTIIMALCLCLSMSATIFAADVEQNGGSGSTPVNLSSTTDGSIGGTPAETAMSVTVPTVFPMAMAQNGNVTTATDCKIINNSFGAVPVGSKIEKAKLTVDLPAGEYDCTALFYNVDPETGSYLGCAGAIINITVLE